MTQFQNTVTIAGNLVADAKIFSTKATLKDGSPFQILEGTLALNGQGENAQPSFVIVHLVGYVAKRLIDANKHLKGSNFGVVGTLVNDKYTTDDGKTRSKIKVKGEDIMFGQNFFGSINSVTLYGHVASDPVTGSKGDISHARMSIRNSVYNAQKKERESSFFDLVAFGKRAEFMGKYFHKGDGVIAQGRIHTSKYDKVQPDGSTITQYNTDIVLNNIAFAQRKNSEDVSDEPVQNTYQQAPQTSEPDFGRYDDPLQGAAYVIDDEELPF